MGISTLDVLRIIKLQVCGLTFIYTLFCSRNIIDECGTINRLIQHLLISW